MRFELTDGCPSLVFKTSALNRSATLPYNIDKIVENQFRKTLDRYQFSRKDYIKEEPSRFQLLYSNHPQKNKKFQ